MKKKLLMVLLPVLLMMAGAFGAWGNERNAVQPGCNNCAKLEKMAPSVNCCNAATPNAAKTGPGCGNCAKANGAAAAPSAATAGCDKCAKLQPVEQPASKGCCNKFQPM